MEAAPGEEAPERLREEGWADGLPGTAGLWPESDPAGSSSDPLRTNTEQSSPGGVEV